MTEKWKDIKDYEGLYQVSNLGNVKSLDRKIVGKDKIEKPYYGRVLSFLYSKQTKKHPLKRCCVELWKDGSRKRAFVHRLVACAFIENPNNKPQVNHIDGNPLNNCVENLEWVTNSENVKHAYANGLINPSNETPVVGTNKLTREKYFFKSVADAAKAFDVTPGSIRAVLKGYGRSKSSCGCTWEYQ